MSTPTQKLLAARERGAELFERRSNQPATHAPRSTTDPCPWRVYDNGLEQEFHLPASDVAVRE